MFAQLVACSATIEIPAPHRSEDTITKPADVLPLDKLVMSINGYASAEDYTVNHPANYVEDSVVWPGGDLCDKFGVVEKPTRQTTRTKAGTLAKMVLTWTNTTIVSSTTMYESYHYDANGKLRVVVIDQESDHSADPGYMQAIDDQNSTILQQEDNAPRSTPAEQVAVINLKNQVKDGQLIFQEWLYFSEDAKLVFEMRRIGVEMARAASFPNIPQILPTLYGDVHPANVIGAPLLLTLPAQYEYRPLIETVVDSTTTMLGGLIAADPFDGELSLKTKPACR